MRIVPLRRFSRKANEEFIDTQQTVAVKKLTEKLFPVIYLQREICIDKIIARLGLLTQMIFPGRKTLVTKSNGRGKKG